MQIVPLRFCHIGTKRASCGLQKRQNPFSAGALPRTPLGELTTLPRLPSWLERGHPSPYPTSRGTNPPSALAMRPPRIPARSTPVITTTTSNWNADVGTRTTTGFKLRGSSSSIFVY